MSGTLLVVTLGKCYWHLVGRAWHAAKCCNAQASPATPSSTELTIWAKMLTVRLLRSPK